MNFFDKDESGDIELIEFMTAFRIANRLFLLEDTHGQTMLSWDVKGEGEDAGGDALASSNGSTGGE